VSQSTSQLSDGARDRASAPDRIGPYEVLGHLATGGMAELLLARRVGIEGFQKVVVLKRILPGFAKNPDFVEMFLHEARLAATLEHPNIVQVFDIGKTDDDYYFAMAYLHGKDVLAILRELIRRNERLPIVHAIAIACGIAAGLHHAHEQVGFDGTPLGIVHRDVSPANAIVTYDGSVKLVDFGIAKAAASANVTRVGVRKGKAAYMSPEQCRGDPLDRRTDIWSLGVVLYEMLTMVRLYRADTDLAIMHRIVSQDVPPPSTVGAEVPAPLEAIVLRCLSRDRDRRYATALELQHALESCARELQLGPSAVGLGAYVRGLFGPPPVPWQSGVMPAPAAAPVTASIDAPSEASPATRDLGVTPPPQLDTAIAAAAARVTAPYPPAAMTHRDAGAGFTHAVASTSGESDEDTPRSKAPIAIAIAAALVLAGGLAWWRLGASPDTATASSTPPVDATPTATTPHVGNAVPPTPAEIEAWLAAVHQTDPARALPLPARHVLLEKLAASSAATRVDLDVQAALDLLQADAAREPCRTFAKALDRIERARIDPSQPVLDAIARAHVPDPAKTPAAGRPPDAGCDGLHARLQAMRPPVEPLPEPEAPAKTSPVRKPPKKPVLASDPQPNRPARTKLDDELRPFKR
jgi:serine/threonine protein kinase